MAQTLQSNAGSTTTKKTEEDQSIMRHRSKEGNEFQKPRTWTMGN